MCVNKKASHSAEITDIHTHSLSSTPSPLFSVCLCVCVSLSLSLSLQLHLDSFLCVCVSLSLCLPVAVYRKTHPCHTMVVWGLLLPAQAADTLQVSQEHLQVLSRVVSLLANPTDTVLVRVCAWEGPLPPFPQVGRAIPSTAVRASVSPTHSHLWMRWLTCVHTCIQTQIHTHCTHTPTRPTH